MKNEEHGLSRDHEQSVDSALEWRCAGCGAPSPLMVQSCECPTRVVWRGSKAEWKRSSSAKQVDVPKSRDEHTTILDLQAKIAGLEGENERLTQSLQQAAGGVEYYQLRTETAESRAVVVEEDLRSSNGAIFLLKNQLNILKSRADRCEAAEQALEGMRTLLREFMPRVGPSSRWPDHEEYLQMRRPTAGLIRRTFTALNPTPQGGKPDSRFTALARNAKASVAENLSSVMNPPTDRAQSEWTCQRCGEDEFSPNVEAFELSGEVVCDACAEQVFEDNSQFGMGA